MTSQTVYISNNDYHAALLSARIC